jgi:hypothetical protein
MVRFTTLFVTVNPNRLSDAPGRQLRATTEFIWANVGELLGPEGAKATITAFGLERGPERRLLHCHYTVIVETLNGGFTLSKLNRRLQDLYRERMGLRVYVRASLTDTGKALNYAAKGGNVIPSRVIRFQN